MTSVHKSFLTLAILAGFTVAAAAQAQPTSEPSNDTPPTAEKADRMRQQSAGAHNPTEKNPTYRNQSMEQPTPARPSKPQVKLKPGEKTTAQHDHRKYRRAPHL